LKVEGVDADWIGPEGLRTRPDFWADRGGMDGFFVTVFRRS
jgi:16S rRNA (cytosine967-C5)-methyltransferase